MAVNNSVQDTLNSIGAIQTLVEKFPMNFFSFGDFNLACSFDVIAILFKILGIDKEEITQKFTDLLCGNMKDTSDGGGFISYAEEIVKIALETNIINILNCTTNPIISNELIDEYKISGSNLTEYGKGIDINVAEIDLMGYLNNNPFTEVGKNFYFDLEDENGIPYTAVDIYNSKDFNAFLWWIINKGYYGHSGCTWDDRYRAKIYPEKKKKGNKNIIKCTYIDDMYPKSDTIRVHLCNETYYKTRKLSKKVGESTKDWSLNKTIFEFNHDFLSSIKLYEPKVMVAEMVQYLMGGTLSLNFGISLNEQVIQEKINSMIEKVITSNDMEINDCFFSFSNEEYNNMLNISQKKRFEVTNDNGEYSNSDVNELYKQLNNITNNSTLENDKSIISNVINSVGNVTPARDAESELNLSINYDWRFELMRALLNPFVRPLFSPKVLFLLAVNKKIMGSIDEIKDWDWEDAFSKLMNSIFFIIKDIIIKLQDMVIDVLLGMIMDKLRPLLELFATRLMLETMKMYKDLLMQLLNECLFGFKIKGDSAAIDDVNYADIVQTEPEQSIC